METSSLLRQIKKHPGWFILGAITWFMLWVFPLGIASVWQSLAGDKPIPIWLAENGWPRLTVIVIGWGIVTLLVTVIIAVVIVLLSRRGRPKLEITFANRPPFTSDGKGNSGILYKKRRVAVTSSVGGKVSLKIPELNIGGASYPNVNLRPIAHQSDELEVDEPGYWGVIETNTHDNSMKLLHTGTDTYDLGIEIQFEIIARCSGMSKRKWITAKLDETKDLHFQLCDGPLLLHAPTTGQVRVLDVLEPPIATEPNIVLIDNFGLTSVSMDENHTFFEDREGRTAVVAKLRNEPVKGRKPLAMGNVQAQIVFTNSNGNKCCDISHGVWLKEKFNSTNFEVGATRSLLLGLIEHDNSKAEQQNEWTVLRVAGLTAVDDNREGVDSWNDPPSLTGILDRRIQIRVTLFSERGVIGDDFNFELNTGDVFNFRPSSES